MNPNIISLISPVLKCIHYIKRLIGFGLRDFSFSANTESNFNLLYFRYYSIFPLLKLFWLAFVRHQNR